MEHPEASFSLYLHVPFCTDKCAYCDFYSVPRHEVPADSAARVIDGTLEQARAMMAAVPGGARAATVYVGGGTPSAISRPLQGKLLRSLSDLHPDEWTVEANPETLDEGFIDLCRESGVDRLSVGIQSLVPEHLRTLRRRATREDCLRAVSLLQKRWTGRISLDFITGIPGQTTADVREDLSVVERDWPSHASLYQLTVEQDTPLDRMVVTGRVRLNGPQTDEDLWFAGRDTLLDRGYGHYEISSFSRPGHECRHNIRYWSIEPYLGAGPAAVGTIPGAWVDSLLGPDPHRGSVMRVANLRDIDAFLRSPGPGRGATIERIEPESFLLETFMMGLRMAQGIATTAVERRFGAGIGALYPGLWDRWVEKGWARPLDTRVRLTENGMMILDTLVGELIDARAGSRASGGLAIAWPDPRPVD